jgi:phage/plasmid-like protein (TIGR03299 family)
MGHNLEIRNGKASIAYAGETPWHKLGQKLDEAFDAATALKKGGLNFTVEKVGIKTNDGKAIENRFALRRTDTQDVLGIVTDFYQPLQNREAFSFFDGVFGKGKARYEVAGVLGKGEKVWLLAKLPGDFTVGREDLVGKWLLLSNGHDTAEPVRAKFTPIRVVCQNTLSAALRGTESEVRIQHIGNVQGKLEIAGKLMKQAGVYFDEMQVRFNAFLKHPLKENQVRQYASLVLGENGARFEELSTIGQKQVEEIQKLHDTGAGHDIKGVRGSLWGAYNAVTEFVDHKRTDKDLGYLVHGRGFQLKQRAYQVAEDVMKGLLNRAVAAKQ